MTPRRVEVMPGRADLHSPSVGQAALEPGAVEPTLAAVASVAVAAPSAAAAAGAAEVAATAMTERPGRDSDDRGSAPPLPVDLLRPEVEEERDGADRHVPDIGLAACDTGAAEPAPGAVETETVAAPTEAAAAGVADIAAPVATVEEVAYSPAPHRDDAGAMTDHAGDNDSVSPPIAPPMVAPIVCRAGSDANDVLKSRFTTIADVARANAPLAAAAAARFRYEKSGLWSSVANDRRTLEDEASR